MSLELINPKKRNQECGWGRVGREAPGRAVGVHRAPPQPRPLCRPRPVQAPPRRRPRPRGAPPFQHPEFVRTSLSSGCVPWSPAPHCSRSARHRRADGQGRWAEGWGEGGGEFFVVNHWHRRTSSGWSCPLLTGPRTNVFPTHEHHL